MALYHEFSIMENNKVLATVSIQDELILYINDSMCWIDTLWNGKKAEKGLNYYGYTLIENNNIIKLREIINIWIKLFENAPNTFILTGDYSLENDEYEKNIFAKNEVLLQLNSLIQLCEKAIEEGSFITHDGI